MTPRPQEFPELACYALGGHSSPSDLIAEVGLAEELGFGSVFLSERFNLKDAGVLAGAAAAASSTIGIATAATNHNTRHPLVTATMATTMHRLSGGRYALGLGRGFDVLFDLMGLPRVTGAQLEDAIGIYRRLWRGEAFAHEGPAGTYPFLSQDSSFAERIPVLMMAIGDRSLDLAGRVADGVVLHTFLTDEALARSVERIRTAAVDAGRDPHAVRVWSVLAVVEDSLPEELRLRKLVGRLATYLQGYGEVLVRANGWDLEDLKRFREDPLVQGYPGAFDAVGTGEELRHLRDRVLPPAWTEASATGNPATCAQRILDQLDAGADSVVLHGSTPAELAPVLEAWRGLRPRRRLYDLPVNPGWARVGSPLDLRAPEHAVRADLDHLDSEWISAALRRPVTLKGSEPVGTGQIGACHRLHLDGEDGPTTVLAKLPAPDAAARAMLAGAYLCEVRFYTQIAATLDVRVPVCHYGAGLPSGDFILLLEDLTPAEQGDQIAGCSPGRARDAALNLAGLHGPRWCDPALLDIEGMKLSEQADADLLADLYGPTTDLFLSGLGSLIPAEDAATLRECVGVAAAWTLARADRFAPIHGDYRLDNLLFPPGGEPGVVAVDWQTLSLGLPARDLAYLVGTSLTIEDRRTHEHDLVAAYHQALLRYTPVAAAGYTLEQCWEDYRFAMLQGPLVAVFGCAYGTRTERGDRMFAAMVTRSCAAMRDLGTLELI